MNAYTCITKNDAFICNGRAVNVTRQLNVNVGSFRSSMGDYNIFIVLGTSNENCPSQEYFYNDLYDVVYDHFIVSKQSVHSNLVAIHAKYSLSTKTIECEINLEALFELEQKFKLHARLEQYKLFKIIEKYGMKTLTSSKSPVLLQNILSRSFTQVGMQHLKIDVCISLNN